MKQTLNFVKHQLLLVEEKGEASFQLFQKCSGNIMFFCMRNSSCLLQKTIGFRDGKEMNEENGAARWRLTEKIHLTNRRWQKVMFDIASFVWHEGRNLHRVTSNMTREKFNSAGLEGLDKVKIELSSVFTEVGPKRLQ